MHDHHHARAVRDEQHRAGDRGERAVERLDPRARRTACRRSMRGTHARCGACARAASASARDVVAQARARSGPSGDTRHCRCLRRRSEPRADHLLVELADAGLGNRVDEVHAIAAPRTSRSRRVRANSARGRGSLLRCVALSRRPAAPRTPRGARPTCSSGMPMTAASATPGHAQDDVLDVERRHPFAAGLHHVLDAVGDLEIALGVDHADVAGVQPAAAPQLPGALGLVAGSPA